MSDKSDKNVERPDKFRQVCVWEATVVGPHTKDVGEFEKFMRNEYHVRVKYLEEIKTFPDLNREGKLVEGTGNRNDLFFAVHEDDIARFAGQHLKLGIRWVEDVLAKHNYRQPIYPSRVFDYKIWEACPYSEEIDDRPWGWENVG